jgi:hypothetical protein
MLHFCSGEEAPIKSEMENEDEISDEERQEMLG